jgi:hypothetical protein
MPPDTAERRPRREGGAPDAANVKATVIQPAAKLRQALEEYGCQPRGSGLKLRARCPVHGSRGGTLAVSRGQRGAVVYCHAGCETTDVLAAIGLCWDDLFDEPLEAKNTWRPRCPAVSPGAAVIVRALEILALRDGMAAGVQLMPLLSPDDRVAWAEQATAQEADAHHWRTLARYAALACDEDYVRQAHAARRAWLAGADRKPTDEQFMVLQTRAEDLARQAVSRD